MNTKVSEILLVVILVIMSWNPLVLATEDRRTGKKTLYSDNQNDCDYVNESDKLGPVWNQSDMGWCYAFSASDLLNHYFYQELNGKRVSPIYLALVYNFIYNHLFTVSSGAVHEVLKNVLVPNTLPEIGFNGICTDISEARVFQNPLLVRLSAQIEQMRVLKMLYDQGPENSTSSEFNEFYYKIGQMDSYLTYIDPQSLYHILENSDMKNFGLKVFKSACKSEDMIHFSNFPLTVNRFMGGVKTIIPDQGPSIDIHINDPSILLSEVHQQLNEKNLVSIHYYVNLISKFKSPKNEIHASTVVGREKINNQCHLIVRNSWGDCDQNSYGPAVTKCQKGYIWINQNKLKPSLDGITYLKKQL